MDNISTETLDKLYLEIGQFTKAKSCKELILEEHIRTINAATTRTELFVRIELAVAYIEEREPQEFALNFIKNI